MTDTNRSWGFFVRVVVKAILLFTLCNLVYVAVQPFGFVGQLSLYGNVLPPRERLPYGENPAEAFNVTVTDLNTLFGSHVIRQRKVPDEYRVVLVGDSATWGWLLHPDETYAAGINTQDVQLPDGRRVVAYNLGYPVMSLTKDLLILERALDYEPDLIVWLVSLESFPADKQTFPPLVQENTDVLLQIDADLPLNVDATTSEEWARTLFGQRRTLSDWLRLQLYGFSWAATGVDQVIGDYDLRRSDFDEDGLLAFNEWDEPTTLTQDDLAFDVLQTGVQIADVPMVVINEPMFISSGQNSDQRYNSLYPRWAYDQYRDLLADAAAQNDWLYYDWWDTIAPDAFTDSPVHLTRDGAGQLANMILDVIVENAGT